MKIGILECGPVADQLQPRYGTYGTVFENMLRPHLPDTDFEKYVVYDGNIPSRPDAADAWLMTGSKFGAYEDHDWIPPLEDFLRRTYAAKVPIVGICFGHQILAQALGGKVMKSDKGWGLGAQSYDVIKTPAWMADAGQTFSSHAVHQDQVVALPTDANVLATSPFCEYAALAYGDTDLPDAITVQPHPELSAEFIEDLVEVRRGSVFDEATADAALQSVGTPVNNDDWAKWIATFFRTRLA